ncbi:MAG: Na+/H+ antiporter subunit E [Rickettsiaceae bacterium]|nr:Na+/H+ antiporter subunit E [Rickettsiaceae bacterium]
MSYSIKMIHFFLSCIFWFVIAGSDGIKHFPIFSMIAIFVTNFASFVLSSRGSCNMFNFALYAVWLIREIVLSSVNVTRIIWSRTPSINPKIYELRTRSSSHLNDIVLYANSITLTPGTLSIKEENGKLLVHCLSEDGFKDLKSGVMENKIATLFQ